MWRRRGASGGADERSARWCRRTTLAATAVFWLVATRWRPWNLFARAGYTNDFYEAQARAMLHLRFDVPADVAGIEGFLIGGRTYLYFGPLLSVARMPFVLFGHAFDGRLTRASMLIGFVALCTAAFHLALAARALVERHAPDRSRAADHIRITAFVAACAVSPVLVLAGWVSVYHETELWGAALCAWTLVHALRFAAQPVRRHAVLTAALAAATLLARATMGFGAALAAGLVAVLVHRRALREAVVVVAGTAAGAVVHLATAYAKLGSFLEMPWLRQQLTIADPSRAAWFAGNDNSFFGLRFLPTTALHYLRPDAVRFERLAPFVRFGPLADDVGGYPLETATPSSSLTLTATVLVVLAAPGAWWLVRRRAWAWLAVLAGASIAAVPSFLIGFVAARYLADMVPMLMVPAAVGAVVVVPPAARGARRGVLAGLVALLAWGAWSNVAFATWIDQLKNPGFTAWRYQLDDVLFPDPAPSLVVIDPARAHTDVPHDGTVGLRLGPSGSCDAVHIVEQGAWAILERSNGGVRWSGTVAATELDDGPLPIAGGATWTILLERTTQGAELGVRATLVSDDPAVAPLTGEAVRVDRPAAAGDAIDTIEGTIDVTVVADDVTRELSVSVGGRTSLFSFGVPADAPLPYASFVLDGDRGDSLCRQLLARR